MRLIRTAILGILAAFCFSPAAFGQAQSYATVVATCGTLPLAYTASSATVLREGSITVDVNGNECVSASVSASISGFAPGGAYATVTSTAASADVLLPAGAVVAAFNTGTTAVSCSLTVGAGVSIASHNVIQASSWFAFTVGSNTHISCINQAGDAASNVVVFSGGTGLPTGAGGGGSGGGGGAVTNAGTFAVQLTGATNNINNIAGTVSLPTGASTSANQTAELTKLDSIITNTGAAIPAGTANIGNVGQISQYPTGATAITASATGTTGATTATLAGTGGKTTFICGYSIRANATAATTVTNTITGTITATLSSIMWVAPAASGIGVDEMVFSPCIPASATNTGIAIVSGAPGTGGTVSSKGWGYQL